MFSPQGRICTILGLTRSPDGRMWFVKQNPLPELTAIEFKIYQAAYQELAADYLIPQVCTTNDPSVLIVESVGASLENILHRPAELFQTREQFTSFLQPNLEIRRKLNKIINQTLTLDDQQFLMNYNHNKLLASIKKIAPENTAITPEDLENHFWSYRAMNAIGIYNEQFKHNYTTLIGSKIDALLNQEGTWLQDNCLRNNASPDGKNVIPFDFNSLHYGLPQMDETGITGLYLFHGILGVYNNIDDREAFIKQRAAELGQDAEKYKLGYILSIIHQNTLLAGYRTQEAQLCTKELLEQKQMYGRYIRETYKSFQNAHDEIEYQSSAAIEAIRTYYPLLAQTSEEGQKLKFIENFIANKTFGQRILMFMQVRCG